MPRKLQELAEGAGDSQLATAIRQSANQIWLAGLGAFAKAQVEGTRIFDGLVKEGQKAQARAKKAALKAQSDSAKFFADLVNEGKKTQSRASRAANSSIADVRAKATGTWSKLESVFEDRVAKALHSLNVPTKKDIDVLGKRVAELTTATKKLAAAPRTSTSAH